MVVKFGDHLIFAGSGSLSPSTTEFEGNLVLSDTDEAGTYAVKNIVVLTQASYDNLDPPNSETLYFII